MVNQTLLYDTLQKINASLNKRFEKNADLYISRQDEYELKKYICNNQFSAVLDMIKGKGIKPEIVLRVLVRNAGVININNIKKFEKNLEPILLSVNYDVVDYMMEDVLHNMVYMQKELKYLLLRYFMNGITEEKCRSYWENIEYKFDSKERKILFEIILLKIISLEDKLAFINEALKNYKNLLIDDTILLRLKSSCNEKEQEILFQYLCEQMGNPFFYDEFYSQILVEAYVSYKEKAFYDAIGKIREGSHKYHRTYIKAIGKILTKENDSNEVMFDDLYEAYQSSDMKNHIKKRIAEKIWNNLKKNNALYQARKDKIDELITHDVEKIEKHYYTSYKEIYKDICSREIKPKKIAYNWLNMKNNELEKSLYDSFEKTEIMYLNDMKRIYEWLFKHSQARGSNEPLTRICNYMASAIVRYEKMYGVVKEADTILLQYVLKYSIRGEKVKEYLAIHHFKEYQNDYQK